MTEEHALWGPIILWPRPDQRRHVSIRLTAWFWTVGGTPWDTDRRQDSNPRPWKGVRRLVLPPWVAALRSHPLCPELNSSKWTSSDPNPSTSSCNKLDIAYISTSSFIVWPHATRHEIERTLISVISDTPMIYQRHRGRKTLVRPRGIVGRD